MEVLNNPSASFSRTISPSSSGTEGTGTNNVAIVGSAGVAVQTGVTIVSISDGGAISDSSGNPECTIGQLQNCALSAGAYNFLSNSFNWNVATAPGVQAFSSSVFGNQNSSHTWIDLAASNSSSYNFLFYLDGAEGSFQITASATVTYNGVAVGTTSALEQVNLIPPQAYADTLSTGSTLLVGGNSNPVEIAGGNTRGTTAVHFNYIIIDASDFSGGQESLTQLLQQDWEQDYYAPTGTTTLLAPLSGKFALDNSYPYGGPGPANDYVENVDTPGWGMVSYLSNKDPYTSSVKIQTYFADFLVYTPVAPPNGYEVDVPVQESTWNWNTSTNLQPDGTYSNPAGDPAVGSTQANFFGDFQWSEKAVNGN